MSEHEAAALDASTQTEVTARSVAEHLNSLLLSADTAAQRIVQEAEARARVQLAEVEQRIRFMEAEAARLTAWRRETEQMVTGLAQAVGGFADEVEGIPRRIEEALAPLATHMPVLARQIEELRGALGAHPPEGFPAERPLEGSPQGSEETFHQESAEPRAEAQPDPGPIETGWAAGWDDLDGNG